MRLFFFKLLCFFSPIIIISVFLVIVDRTGYINNYNCKQAALALRESNLEFNNPNFNDRGLLVERLKLMSNARIQKAIIGNSRGLLIGESISVPGIVNLSVTGATTDDYRMISYYLDLYNIKIDTCYIIVDPVHLMTSTETVYKSIHPDIFTRLRFKINKLADIRSAYDIFKSFYGKPLFVKIDGFDTDNLVRFKDGSIKYHKSFMYADGKTKIKRINSVASMQIDFDKANLSFLTKFFKKFKNPIIIKSPYHPRSFDLINKNGAIDSANKLLKKNFRNISQVGEYNPRMLNLLEDSLYYDGRHPKGEVIKKIIFVKNQDIQP